MKIIITSMRPPEFRYLIKHDDGIQVAATGRIMDEIDLNPAEEPEPELKIRDWNPLHEQA